MVKVLWCERTVIPRGIQYADYDVTDEHCQKHFSNKQFSQETVYSLCGIDLFVKHRKYHVSFLVINVKSVLTSRVSTTPTNFLSNTALDVFLFYKQK